MGEGSPRSPGSPRQPQSYLGHLSEGEGGIKGSLGTVVLGELLYEGLMLLVIAVVRGLLSIGVNLWVDN